MYNPHLTVINDFQYRQDIIQCIADRLEHMTCERSRTMVVRLDARFPDGYPHNGGNGEISALMAKIMEWFRYHKMRMAYVWVREQNTSPVPHYHVVLFIGNPTVPNGWSVHELAAHFWSMIIGGNYGSCIHLCRTHEGYPDMQINRPTAMDIAAQDAGAIQQFEITKQTAMDWLIYFAKTHTKGNAPHGIREFQGSQI